MSASGVMSSNLENSSTAHLSWLFQVARRVNSDKQKDSEGRNMYGIRVPACHEGRAATPDFQDFIAAQSTAHCGNPGTDDFAQSKVPRQGTLRDENSLFGRADTPFAGPFD